MIRKRILLCVLGTALVLTIGLVSPWNNNSQATTLDTNQSVACLSSGASAGGGC